MPKLTIMPDGIKGSLASGMNRTPPKRGETKGWTASVARRNRDFLQSVIADELDGVSVSASLTLGRASRVTPEQFTEMRNKLFKRLRRMDLIRLHWVAEFQQDGTPHLHCLAFFPSTIPPWVSASWMVEHWLDVSKDTGSAIQSQHVVPTFDLTGWKKYLAKHAARGVSHMQRECPEGWENPGRMWGKLGEWPVGVDEREICRKGHFRLRRWQRNWDLSILSKRATSDPSARAALKGYKRGWKKLGRKASECRGYSRWCPDSLSMRMVQGLGPDCMVRDWEQRSDPPAPKTSNIVGDGGSGYVR